MEIEGYIKVYDTRDLNDLRPQYKPEGQTIFHPYTNVEPPQGNNVKVTGFDFTTGKWNYMEVATPEDVEQQDQQNTEAMMAITELFEITLGLMARIGVLEGEPAVEEPTPGPEAPSEGEPTEELPAAEQKRRNVKWLEYM